ncbi:unnamed protein product [Paramecium sonneborni]|uniref:Uncharacterized protein n=1 Tax=Paramecium sonneborni TaxID=65129 RepID=A0A8S1MN21_9CILI|nr:unnamed protein product [Paramecium sonneborni]
MKDQYITIHRDIFILKQKKIRKSKGHQLEKNFYINYLKQSIQNFQITRWVTIV